MANLDFLAIVAGKQKVTPSSTNTVDFLSIKVGASALEIKETTGHFDFSAKKLTNIASGGAAGEALSYTQRGASLGVASLDAGGKVPASQLPNSVMEFQGQYNATTNSPVIVDGTGNAGDVYRVQVAGTQDFGSGSQTFAIGDWIMYSGTIWEKASNSNAVSSVNGFTGVVVLSTTDVGEGTNLYFTEARVRASLITGFVSGAGTVTAADSLLSALNKLDGNTALKLNTSAFTDAAVTGKLLTGYVSGAGTLAATDTILQGFNKLNGNILLKQDIITASNGIKKVGVDVQRDDAISKTNDNAGSITVGQVVYIKANSNVDLAKANVALLGDFALAIVQDASIATTASGLVVVRQGAILSGFSGLTPGHKQYVSRATFGALTESLAGFTTGESVYCVGRALSATTIAFDPQFEFEY